MKSREAALTAIRVFNDPQVNFKSETFIVLMMIAWTYLLHAYYRAKQVEYRYYKQGPKRRIFDRTKHGAYKYWELERCLNESSCPLDRDTANNLQFLLGLRHEIEHQMTKSLDAYLRAPRNIAISEATLRSHKLILCTCRSARWLASMPSRRDDCPATK